MVWQQLFTRQLCRRSKRNLQKRRQRRTHHGNEVVHTLLQSKHGLHATLRYHIRVPIQFTSLHAPALSFAWAKGFLLHHHPLRRRTWQMTIPSTCTKWIQRWRCCWSIYAPPVSSSNALSLLLGPLTFRSRHFCSSVRLHTHDGRLTTTMTTMRRKHYVSQFEHEHEEDMHIIIFHLWHFVYKRTYNELIGCFFLRANDLSV